jgi:hypothetical protein
MKTLTFICVIFATLSISCNKKETIEIKSDIDSQTLRMQINGQDWVSTSHNSSDREALHGQYTEFGNKGLFTPMYTITATKKVDSQSQGFRIQIYNLGKTGDYFISGADDIYKSSSTHVVYSKRLSNAEDDVVMYTANPQKSPFKVVIKNYDIPYGSLLPTVGGSFEGVLFNMKNKLDSVIISEGSFEVRY